MFLVRLFVLGFLFAYSWSMGHEPRLNAFGSMVAMSFFVVAPALYFLPTYEAWKLKHSNINSILLVNLFLGWTLIGWVVAVVWAFKTQETVIKVTVPETAKPKAVSESRGTSETKACPFCAEEVLAAAIKCKHCGSMIEAQS